MTPRRPRTACWSRIRTHHHEMGREVTAAAEDEARERARRLGLQSGLRPSRRRAMTTTSTSPCGAGIEEVVGGELVDEDYDDVVDVVLLWWRDDDGDLVDALMDAIGPLTDQGVVWLVTPKPGRPGHVEAEDIADAAPDRRTAADEHHQRRARTGRELDWWHLAPSGSVGSHPAQRPGSRSPPCQSRLARRHRTSLCTNQFGEKVTLSDYRGEQERRPDVLPLRVHAPPAPASCARSATGTPTSSTTTPS